MSLKVGDKFQHTFVVSEEVYQGFIAIFNDKNPLHTNDLFAISKGFEGKVMHGNILGGFISYFIGELLPIKNVAIQQQSISYNKPVYFGDELIFEAQINDIFESVNLVEFYFWFSCQAKKVAKGKIEIGIL